VIFLDLPGWTCLWGIFQRRLGHCGGQHPAVGVYDRITWGFMRYVVGYRKKMAPRVRALIADHAGNAQVTVLHSRASVRRYVATASMVPPVGSLHRQPRWPCVPSRRQ
jgi:hypothetical protein